MSEQSILINKVHLLTTKPNETILETINNNQYTVKSSCHNGVCSACETVLVKGKVYDEKQNKILTEQDTEDILICTCYAKSDIEIELSFVLAPGEIQVQQLACQIKTTEYLSENVLQVKLLTPANKKYKFYAGQYLDIILSNEKKCSFSIANTPKTKRLLELHIGLENNSEDIDIILNLLKTEYTIPIEIPKGQCFINHQVEEPLLLIAASTGFSQIKSLLEFVLDDAIQQPIYFYWGCKNSRDFYFHDTLMKWQEEHELFNYRPVVSNPIQETNPTIENIQRTGLLYQSILSDFDSLEGFRAYASGSPNMVYNTFDALEKIGLEREKMHSDVFQYAPRK